MFRFQNNKKPIILFAFGLFTFEFERYASAIKIEVYEFTY